MLLGLLCLWCWRWRRCLCLCLCACLCMCSCVHVEVVDAIDVSLAMALASMIALLTGVHHGQAFLGQSHESAVELLTEFLRLPGLLRALSLFKH